MDRELPPDRRVTKDSLVIAVAVTAVLFTAVAAGVILLLNRGDAGESATDDPVAERVRLEPVGAVPPDPFTESLVTADTAQLVAFGDARRVANAVPATPEPDAGDPSAAVLFGSTARPPCDAERLVRTLESDAPTAAAWAEAAAVEPARATETIRSLTPVVLAADTAVTNHSYSAGDVSSFQSILQAGTPVLIDATGVPRVQCSCGNPLDEPRAVADDAEYDGEAWDGFSQESVVEITPSPTPLAAVRTVDVASGEASEATLGGTRSLTGILAADGSGVSVVDPEAGTTSRVLDQPVSDVYDDGAGGLVYMLKRTDLQYPGGVPERPPADPAFATIWHLPAGATEPVAVVDNGGDPNRWNVLLGVGRLGSRDLVVYGALTPETSGGPEAPEVGSGPVVVRDLATGADTVIGEDGFGWEQSTRNVSFGADRLVFEWGYDTPDWARLGPDLQPLPTVCTVPEDSDSAPSACPWSGVLNDTGRLVSLSSNLQEANPDESAPVAVLTVGLDDDADDTWLDVPGLPVPTRGSVLDTREGKVLVTYLDDDGEAVRALEVGPDASVRDMGIDGSGRYLRAPLVRPAATVTTVAPPDVAALDVQNVQIPPGACRDYSDRPAGAITLVDGSGETGPTSSSPDYVSAWIDPAGVIQADVDQDGAVEIVAVVSCNWGGSGYSTNIVAMRPGPAGGLVLVGEPVDDYGKGSRAVTEIAEESPGVFRVGGDEWGPDEATCCPTLRFSTRWAFQAGAWTELGG